MEEKTTPSGSVEFPSLSLSLSCPLEAVREREIQGLLKWIPCILVWLIGDFQQHLTGSPSLPSKKLYR